MDWISSLHIIHMENGREGYSKEYKRKHLNEQEAWLYYKKLLPMFKKLYSEHFSFNDFKKKYKIFILYKNT